MRTKIKERRCANPRCGKSFTPTFSTLQKVCSPRCAVAIARKQSREAKVRILIERIKERERTKALKDKAATPSELSEKLQEVVNAIAREIDKGAPCISCGLTTGKPQGGHYHSVAANSSLRYNLHNIHLQDFQCNHILSSNRGGYEAGIIERYGARYLKFIKVEIVREYKLIKLSKAEIIEATKKAREFLRWLRADGDIGECPRAFTAIQLRERANKFIGIYK